jgi:hypothetical protein
MARQIAHHKAKYLVYTAQYTTMRTETRETLESYSHPYLFIIMPYYRDGSRVGTRETREGRNNGLLVVVPWDADWLCPADVTHAFDQISQPGAMGARVTCARRDSRAGGAIVYMPSHPIVICILLCRISPIVQNKAYLAILKSDCVRM